MEISKSGASWVESVAPSGASHCILTRSRSLALLGMTIGSVVENGVVKNGVLGVPAFL
jgi:hypothetical protein